MQDNLGAAKSRLILRLARQLAEGGGWGLLSVVSYSWWVDLENLSRSSCPNSRSDTSYLRKDALNAGFV